MTKKVKKVTRSMGFAIRGLKDVLVHEHVFQTMAFVAVLTTAAMLYFPTTKIEKLLLLTMIFAVLSLELVNSVIERIMDFIHAEHHVKVGEIKDLMASIVFVTSIGAATIGIIIFWPYVFG